MADKLPAPAAILFLCLVLAGLMGGCQGDQPIKIGFVGGITGRHSDLGVSGRDGVILAVEEINRSGGVDGRRVELSVKDDRQDPETARRVDRELIAEGVWAVIGHMTSAMSLAALPVIDQNRVLFVSPTTSTNKLSGRDDYFLRVMSPNTAETANLFHYAYQVLGLRRMAAFYDLSNRGYTEDWVRDFRSAFESLGGRMVAVRSFLSTENLGYTALVKDILRSRPDGVLLAAGAVDAAMICQQMKKQGVRIPVLSSGWAMTDLFIQDGGRAVEEVIFSSTINAQSPTPRWKSFKRAYENRFGIAPDFAAIHAYDAAQVVFQALARGADRRNMKKVVLKHGRFQGVQGPFTLDKYGDPHRKQILVSVRNGRFESME